MTFAGLPSGSSVFFDANVFVFHFSRHPQWGEPCTELLERIDRQEVRPSPRRTS